MEVAGVLPPVAEKFGRGAKGPRPAQTKSADEADEIPENTSTPLVMNEDQEFSKSSPLEVDPTA